MPQPKENDPYATDPDFKQEWFGNSAVSGRGNIMVGRDKRIDILLQALILAGILGLVGIVWTLRDNLTEIKTFVTIKAQQYDRDIARLDSTITRHDERITVLERSQGAGNSQPDDRQKR